MVVGVFTRAFERALHHKALVTGRSALLGPAGPAPVVVRRLLDARPVRRYLTLRPERNVALIVSERIFRDVVDSGLCAFSHHLPGRLYDPDRTEVVEWLL